MLSYDNSDELKTRPASLTTPDQPFSFPLVPLIIQLLDLDKALAEGFYPLTERYRRRLPPPADFRAAWEERVEPFRECLPQSGEPRSVVLRDLMVIVALRCGYDARTRCAFACVLCFQFYYTWIVPRPTYLPNVLLLVFLDVLCRLV